MHGQLAEIGHHATLPWPVHAYDHARKVMGETTGPTARTSKHAGTLARYSFQQGLSVRQVALNEMFARPPMN